MGSGRTAVCARSIWRRAGWPGAGADRTGDGAERVLRRSRGAGLNGRRAGQLAW